MHRTSLSSWVGEALTATRFTNNGHEGPSDLLPPLVTWKHVEPDLEELVDGGEQVISVETTRVRG
jgi:hypothetical protein